MSSSKIESITIPSELEAEMTPAVRGFVGLLLDRIAKLEARAEELERQVKGKTPQNSSLPPSTQHPHNRPQSERRKSRRKRGGQPGHEKHERPLIPTNECDDVQRLKPTECRRCGAKLSGSDPEPLRHQVWEVPEIKAHVTEYQRHRQWLWTFLRHEGIEPTNNAGERSLRHAVIWRKLSFGARSAAGSRFVETMLTVIETCRQQRRNAFAFLTCAIEAHLNHQPAPSLLPRA